MWRIAGVMPRLFLIALLLLGMLPDLSAVD
jgi:hypothetical protein